MATLVTWLGVNGLSILLGFLGDMFMQYLRDSAAREADKELGRLEVERAQAAQAALIEAELAEQAVVAVDPDDAIDRLDKGTA